MRHTKRMPSERRAPSSRRAKLDRLPPFLNIGELASVYSISRGLAYQMVKRGTVASIRCGRLIRIPRSAIE